MGRRSVDGGVRPKGPDRIEFEFWYHGKRYRPTLLRKPTEANLRRARVQLAQIERAIEKGTFDFAEEFPNYRLKSRMPSKIGVPSEQPPSESPAPLLAASAVTISTRAPEPPSQSIPESSVPVELPKKPTCGEVFNRFLSHCRTRVALDDMAYSTLGSYQQILESMWRPRIGEDVFEEVIYSRLQSVVANYAARTAITPKAGTPGQDVEPLSKKTYNNIVSAIRCAFEFGYKDYPEKHNPALRLKTLRITKKDKEPPDPFTIQEGEIVIARSHREFGEAHGNYEEFRFFTALRPSEQFALKIGDCDLASGKIRVQRARVRRREKNRTKTNENREIELCGRALEVLKRHLTLRERLVQAGAIRHEFVFFQADGAPLVHLSYPYQRWRYVLETSGVRYREPYNARHSFISWSLMIGKNMVKLAEEDGHTIQTMLTTYTAWTKGATAADTQLIIQAMEHSPEAPQEIPQSPLTPPALATTMDDVATTSPKNANKTSWGKLSWRKRKHFNSIKWRSGRDSNPRPPA